MASLIARRAFSTTARRMATGEEALKSESKKNPEIMILGGVMVAALAGAGYYFGRSPTKSTSENSVPLAKNSMPWETDATHGKYQYHPGGDSSAAPKDAPSAVNVVVVPDVELPKRLHDKYNKWGKDGY
ncbi:hypothetical protein F5144DRAFT_655159 [Chaetomium tenue]|uniref:Uncharacterized protein n=2 Tax=Chaetomium TaxID=5149 RepID=Q2H484_CHAGB|nr:uncharacterized protein CHGG_06531 [Chaetomium globosum CBS 148.51]EAQ89912.1 predicted protein [Chaetomium globosum CBS 148.51]KAH6628626.1 hypothetical protein F5144DRAFT_655159 [Chaetomium globosum]